MRRFIARPQSSAGDFYVVNGDCLACGVPHTVAPDLMAWADESELDHCVWKKQPATPEEMEQAISVIVASEIGCHRYAGTDRWVMEKIGPEFCDSWNGPATPFRMFLPREFTLTLLESRGIAVRFFVALMLTAVFAVAVWLIAH